MFAPLNQVQYIMNRILYVIAGFVILSSCNTGNNYTISGTLDGLSGEEVVRLEQRIDKKYLVIDSVTTSNGVFEFTGKVEMPDLYYIGMPGKRGKGMIFLENSQGVLSGLTVSLHRFRGAESLPEDPIQPSDIVIENFLDDCDRLHEIYENGGDLILAGAALGASRRRVGEYRHVPETHGVRLIQNGHRSPGRRGVTTGLLWTQPR